MPPPITAARPAEVMAENDSGAYLDCVTLSHYPTVTVRSMLYTSVGS